MSNRLPILGREQALAKGLTRLLKEAAIRRHDYGSTRTEAYGYSFQLQLRDPDDQPTGVTATVRVSVNPRKPGPYPEAQP